MIVGVDIDGFLTDIYHFQLNKGMNYFNSLDNYQGYSIRDMYNCSRIEEVKFWFNNMDYYLVKPRSYASNFINHIKDNNGKVYIITSRAMTTHKTILGKVMRHYVKKWLDENNIYYDKIIFTKNKLKYIKKYNINIMGEDSPINANKLCEHTKIILMNSPYNEDVSSDNIYRVNNFKEAINIVNDYVKEMSK